MIKILLLAVVPFMTQHRNVVPKTEVSTNFYGSVTGIVDKAYIEARVGAGGGGIDTNAVDILANSAVVTNALTVATTNRVAALETETKNLASSVSSLESSKADKAALTAHTENTDNPHGVTAEQVGAVPFVVDSSGNKTAVTIGSRKIDSSVGEDSFANGSDVTATGRSSHAEGVGTTAYDGAHAEGVGTTAMGYYSHAEGQNTIAVAVGSHADGIYSCTLRYDDYSYTWNGDGTKTEGSFYTSHGPGTFNINPLGGLDGFYIGDKQLSAIILGSVTNNISATNPTFSNAVLAVGLNIDTNSVAVLNEISATFGGFPIGGTATTVGGLLAALAAAAAWLKKNKVGSFASVGGATATVENGVAKLDDFFTESTGFTPPTGVAGALKNSMLEKSIVLAVTENFGDADNTSYGSAT